MTMFVYVYALWSACVESLELDGEDDEDLISRFARYIHN